MKKFLVLGSVALVAAGCTPEMEASLAEERKPRVIAATPVSVTVSQYGNSMVNTRPEAATVFLAAKTCESMGKSKAVHSSFTDPDKGNMFDPEYMRNHQFFLCQ